MLIDSGPQFTKLTLTEAGNLVAYESLQVYSSKSCDGHECCSTDHGFSEY